MCTDKAKCAILMVCINNIVFACSVTTSCRLAVFAQPHIWNIICLRYITLTKMRISISVANGVFLGFEFAGNWRTYRCLIFNHLYIRSWAKLSDIEMYFVYLCYRIYHVMLRTSICHWTIDHIGERLVEIPRGVSTCMQNRKYPMVFW